MGYWLDEDMTWETVPDEMEEPRIDHCQVQINDCEIAFIGGCRGDDTSACSDVTASDVVDIWNYKERTWRTGPKLMLDISKNSMTAIWFSLMLLDMPTLSIWKQ